jgi:Holliday junction DNA helicase RuvA
MIRYLQGRIISKKEKFIVVEAGGFGYKVFVSEKTLEKMPKTGEEIKLYCFLDVKDKALDLYGFLSEPELEFFELLESIRGLGPKAALKIASLGPLEKIKERILTQDQKLLEKISGIGRKKAMAVVLELSGKIKNISQKKKKEEIDEAQKALVALGFSRHQAKFALSQVSENIKEVEQRIKEALKILGK